MTRSRGKIAAISALGVVLGHSAYSCVGGQTGTPISDICTPNLSMLRADAAHLAGFAGSYVGAVTVEGRLPPAVVTSLRLGLTAFPEQVSPNLGSRSCSEGTVPARVTVHTEGENGLHVELRGQLTKRRTAGAELTIEDDEAYGTLLLFEDAPASLELEVGIETFTAAELARE